MTKTPYLIYGLIDPRNHELYYVGKTRRVLHDRMDEHFFDAADTLVAKKNRAILASGGLPQILKLDTAVDEATAFHKELAWIHTFAGQGRELKNREAQAWFRKRYDEVFGAQEPKNPSPVSRARPRAGKAIPDLHPETYGKVQALCSTLNANDIAELEAEWRAWLATPGKEPTKHPDAAFLAFCKRKLQS
jgi:hypothetical protein